MTKEAQKIVRGERQRRTSLVNQGRLVVENKDPNKVYRFVNDKDGRVELKQDQGWDVELAKDHRIGGRRVDTSSAEGTAARVNVGAGDHAILMSIPKEWYEEDQAAKQERVDASEQTIKQTALNGHKGSFQVSRSRVPD